MFTRRPDRCSRLFSRAPAGSRHVERRQRGRKMPDGTGTTIAIHSPRLHTGPSSFDRLVRFLDPDEFRAVCVIDCLCARLPPPNGPPSRIPCRVAAHRLPARCSPPHWVAEHFVASSLGARIFDFARQPCGPILKRGFWGAGVGSGRLRPRGRFRMSPVCSASAPFSAPGGRPSQPRKESCPRPRAPALKAVRDPPSPRSSPKGVGWHRAWGP